MNGRNTSALGDAARAQALSARLFAASLGAGELMTVYLGMKLGLYAALRDAPARAGELAERTGIAARYAREWLEQQAAAGFLDVDTEGEEEAQRRYTLPSGHAEALLDDTSPFAVAPLTLMPVGGMGPVLPRLLDAYRSGEGVPYADYSADFRGGQSGLNTHVFRTQLPGWLRRALPGLHAVLGREGARLADVACGTGTSSFALADTYPALRVCGFDVDEPSIAVARAEAVRRGVGERVRFHAVDVAAVPDEHAYDVVTVFDALHDMPDPVAVLRGCRGLLAPGGTLLLMEPRVRETFQAPADEIERFFYTVSVLHCLPVGLSTTPSAGTGTVIRPALVREYATEAGFPTVEVVDVAHRFHRLYRLSAS
ncbi:methyltransferase domain-containing protein [Saccharomonospora xinjiangensis]|uniref:class I SAM-dependent methyltransferase n=1 Tax=Saccharomonospora xinjiangensis TaxID=75294 RepID=UPI00106F4C92|nr:methyltransferase domain-containing protein [Saccharomonospora xinjiangensis]QBQ60738.1 Demethylrebeccamycin-D-glucose O-methyltransferase [Saccharomonospora xinjiangensis]